MQAPPDGFLAGEVRAGAEIRIGQAVEVQQQGGALAAEGEVVLDPSLLLGGELAGLAGMIGREPLRVRVGVQIPAGDLLHGVSQLLAHVSASSSGTASAK